MSSSFTSIPILDLSLAKDPSTRQQLIKELHQALTEVGFLYIKNHGVNSKIISNLVDSLPNLFALPPKFKNAVALHNSPHYLGYSQAGSEKTANATDLREQFEFATELPYTGNDPPYLQLLGPNQWPESNLGIRQIVEDYIASLTELSESFLTLVTESLGLPPGALHEYLSTQHRLKVVHYPADEFGGGQGVGPHKDSSGWWTFLLQASPYPIGGLQALNRAGEWIDIPSLPGTFVVNIGQAFEVVSGGLCPATTHRVLSGSQTRYSVPFFQGVRGDAKKVDFERYWDVLNPGTEKQEIEAGIDSAFLRGDVETWGQWQLNTKVKSHPAP